MRRRRRLTVDTFPFLAVLLAAMGSLILVLLIFDYRAKKAAQQRVEAVAARQNEEAERKAAERRAELLAQEAERRREWEQKRDALRREAEARQAALSRAIEEAEAATEQARSQDEAERQALTVARKQGEQEQARLEALQHHLASGTVQVRQGEAATRQAQESLRQLTTDLVQLEQTVRDLKTTRGRDPHTYSVVPYRGKQGTERRPIYVECMAHGVIFHPDRGAHAAPFDPAEVRADLLRRIERQRPTLPVEQQKLAPYVLVLVRPEGIDSYYDFQAALKDQPVVFGYEFIESDWELEFPKDLAETTEAVQEPVPRGGAGGSGSRGKPLPEVGSTPPASSPAVTTLPGPPPEQPRRPARVRMSHDWILFVECLADGIVLHPGKKALMLNAIETPSGSNPLRAQVVERLQKQPEPAPGKAPTKPRVRFVVHPDGGRSFHAAYPALVGLPIDMDRVTLQPGDDVRAILLGQ